MDREFLTLFNQELGLLKEQAKDFAADYPGIAGRLGGLIEERPDNMILGLLEGAAFLAARVQLKLKHEFPEFTSNLLEQLVPNYLAPTPSAMLARAMPPFGDPSLREGWTVPRGSYLDATYRERERRVSCRYRLTSDLTLGPLDIVQAEYVSAAGPLQALGLEVGPDVQAGLRLRITCRSAADLSDEVGDLDALKQPDKLIAGCRIADLSVTILGDVSEAVALYEQLFANCTGIYLRTQDQFGDTVKPVPRLPLESLHQVGFGEAEALMPNDKRVFHGFDLLREYFMFPRKFLGFRLVGLDRLFRSLRAKSFDLVFTFNAMNPRLPAAVRPERFALYTAPAINLFTMDADRIPVKANQHEYHVVPDRTRSLDYEPQQILDVFAHYPGGKTKVRVPPLYAVTGEGRSHPDNLFFTTRRLPRRQTADEKKFGSASDYKGTDVFLSLVEPGGLDADTTVTEISLRALCSNRHLPEHLPVGTGAADFQLLDKADLPIVAADGPTRPREPVIAHLRSRTEVAHTGVVTWRLVNMLALNHLGLVERGGGRDGRALKEVLTMFADLGDSTAEKRIRGIRSVESRPVVRRVRRPGGVGAARGLEVTVTLDERAFEGHGAFLLGAMLDRFFKEYAAINSYTQTVIRTIERGEIMRWPVRMGDRGPL